MFDSAFAIGRILGPPLSSLGLHPRADAALLRLNQRDDDPVGIGKVRHIASTFKLQLRAKRFHASCRPGVVITVDQHVKMIDPRALSSARLSDNKRAGADPENKLAPHAPHLQAT